jgi:type II secretory pathway pseudopilin PulG
MSSVLQHGEGRQSGFTLMELVLALIVAGLATVATMAVFGAQNRASDQRRAEVDAQQNARAAMDALVRDLRMAGTNIDRFHRQVAVIDAAPYQIAFNGDVRSGVGGDGSMYATEQMPISGGANYVPGSFLDENLEELVRFNNGAETVRLTFDVDDDGAVTAGDSLAGNSTVNDFQLVREVNGGADEIVAYGLRGLGARPDGSLPPPVFQYWGLFDGATELVLWGDDNGDGELSSGEIGNLTPVAQNELANVREIAVTVEAISDESASHGLAADQPTTLLTTRVRPRNIGLNTNNMNVCGNPPVAPASLTAMDTPDDGGRSITVTLTASYDDVGGENDVREYSVYRRKVGQSNFGAPIYHIKATHAGTYEFVNDQTNSKRPEDAPVDGIGYEYYVTAWDCEPQESNPSDIAGPVVSQPNGPEPPALTQVIDTPCDEGGDVTVVFTASADDQASQPEFTGYRVYRGTSPGITAYKVRILDVAAANTPTYTVHDVTSELVPISPDSSYYYVVRGVRFEIESVDSNQRGPIMVTDGVAQASLTQVEDMPGDFGQRLMVHWLPSPSEQCTSPYNVYRYDIVRRGPSETSFGTQGTVAAEGRTAYAWVDSTVTPQQSYEYKVVAHDASGESAESNMLGGQGSAENTLQPPLAVLAQDEPCDPNGAIRISWTASPNDLVGEVTHYKVSRGVAPGVYDYELPWVEAATDPTYAVIDDANLSGSRAPQLGTTYYYAVRSHNEHFGITSGLSNESSVLSESTPTAPDVLSAVDTPNDGGRSITLMFKRSDHDGSCDNTVTSYRVYRGTNPMTVSTFLGTVTAMQQETYTFLDNLVYSLAPPVDGTPYYYGVRAYTAELVSALSNVGGPAVAVRDGAVNEILFADNFEASLGWTHGASSGTDNWAIGDPAGLHGSSLGYPDPQNAVSGVKVAGTKITGSSGLYARNSSMWFTSPKVDCQSASNVKMLFSRWLNVERSTRDRAEIYVRWLGSGWQRVWQNSSSGNTTDNAWSPFELDISVVAGRRDVQVQFVLTSNSSNDFTGWNIDDFQLEKY